MLRMRRESSVPPASATVVANPAARLIALPMIKVSRDEGLSSSQYLEMQSPGPTRRGRGMPAAPPAYLLAEISLSEWLWTFFPSVLLGKGTFRLRLCQNLALALAL